MAQAQPKKYAFTGVTKIVDGRTVKRIKYLIDVKHMNGEILVSAGEEGGWVEGELNLRQNGFGAVLNEAVAMEDVQVAEGSVLLDQAVLSGKGILGQCVIAGDSNVKILENYSVQNVCIVGNAFVMGDKFHAGLEVGGVRVAEQRPPKVKSLVIRQAFKREI